jgi:hypothetical protein
VSGHVAAVHIGSFLRRGNPDPRMSLVGQKLLLPQCNSNGRFTSVSGHKGRRSWMMRALRILDSPCAPTLGILRDFQDNLLPVSRVRRRGQAGCC